MRRLAFVATAVLATAPLFAGVRIQMENTDLATNKTTTQVIMMDNTRLRVDADEKTSMMFLTDGGRNRMVILDKAKNTYQEIDEQTMKQMGQQVSGAMAQMEAAMKNMPPEQRAMMEKMMKGKMPQAAARLPRPCTPRKAAAPSTDSAAPSTKGCGAPKRCRKYAPHRLRRSRWRPATIRSSRR